MESKDFVLEIECMICGRKFGFFVNKKAFHEFMSYENERSPKELFPHLMQEEINFITTQICEHCA